MVAFAPAEKRTIEPRWGSAVHGAVTDGYLLLECVRRGIELSTAARLLGFLDQKRARKLLELAWADEHGLLAAAENGSELTLKRCFEVAAGVLAHVPMVGADGLIDVAA